MNRESIKELIQSARKSATSHEGHELIDHFETFVSLLDRRDSAQENPNFIQELMTSHSQFWTAFQKAATQSGLTPEMIKQHLETVQHMTPKQWGHLQEIYQAIPDEGAKKAPKKLRKSGKRTRI